MCAEGWLHTKTGLATSRVELIRRFIVMGARGPIGVKLDILPDPRSFLHSILVLIVPRYS